MADRDLTSELRHRRQQRRAAATILVVLLMLFFAFWYAFSYYRASSTREGASGPQPTCRPYDPKAAAAGNTTVNVYNASGKNGLAARTASDLRSRGFTIGEVDNDPLRRTLTGPAEVRFGPAGSGRAQLVIPLAGKGTTQLVDKRTTAVVDLVLGPKFTALTPATTATGTPMCPAPTTSTEASPSGTALGAVG